MNFRTCSLNSFLLAGALSLAAVSARAQQEPDPSQTNTQQQPQEPAPIDQQQAKPAARAFPTPLILYGSGGDEQDTNPYATGYSSDFSPLTGVQNATLGVPDLEHSYWVPGVQYGLNAVSPPNNTPGSSWNIENFVIGNVTLIDTWSRSQLAFDYSGGGFFSTDQSQVPNGQYQSMSVSEAYHANRWIFQVLDQFSYLPQSAFGFGGGTNLGVPGIGGTLGGGIGSLGNSYVPGQSIYGQGPQLMNAAGMQFTYALTKRSSITASAVYGLLHFTQSGYVDSNTFSAGLGYNYAISPKDTIGIVYHFNNYQFPGNSQAYDDHTISLAYGRKITGRLALRITGGPEITVFRIPYGNTSHTIGESVSASLTYAFENSSISANYGHGLSGGSGIYIGSELDQLSFSANRKITRMWTAFTSIGYANNRPLVSGIPNAGYNYSSVYVGGGLNRPLGRDMRLGLAYTASFNSTSSGCVGVACNSVYDGQTFTLNFQWHTRPFLIRSF